MTTEKLHHIGADLYLPNDFAEYDMSTEYDGLSVSVTIHWDSASAEHRLTKIEIKSRDGNINSGTIGRLRPNKLKRTAIGKHILHKLSPTRYEWWQFKPLPRRNHRRGLNDAELKSLARIYVAARYGDGDAHDR